MSRRFQYTLGGLLFLVALVAILVSLALGFLVPPEPDIRWVTTLSFSPDGETLAVGTYCWRGVNIDCKNLDTDIGQIIELVDIATGHPSTLFRGSVDPGPWGSVTERIQGRCVHFSPDGTIIATATWQDRAGLYDATTGEVLKEFPVRPGGYGDTSVVFSPDGKHLATLGYNSVFVWNLASGRKRVIPWAEQRTRALDFSPDGNTVVTMKEYGRVLAWDVASGKQAGVYPQEVSAFSHVVKFSPDGQMLAAGEVTNTANGIRLWSVPDGSKGKLLETSGFPRSLAFSPDGKQLAIAHGANEVAIWDIRSGRTRKARPKSHRWFTSVAYSPNGRIIAAGDTGGRVTLWNAETLTPIRTIEVGGKRHLLKPPWIGPLLALGLWAVFYYIFRKVRQCSKNRVQVRKARPTRSCNTVPYYLPLFFPSFLPLRLCVFA